MRAADIAEATRLMTYTFTPRHLPARDEEYRRLVARYRTDEEFAGVTRAVASGMDLVILAVDERTGIVAASTEESVFAVKMSDYSRRAGGEGKAHERVLHALAHLGAAALANPRPADLADETYVGRISVEGVEAFVREAAARLAETVDAARHDPATDAPGMEAAWRAYVRRARAGTTGDGRKLRDPRTGSRRVGSRVSTRPTRT